MSDINKLVAEMQAIQFLRSIGYVVSDKRDGRLVLSWNEIDAEDGFRERALEKIKAQITVDHIQFVKTIDGPYISSARLYLL